MSFCWIAILVNGSNTLPYGILESYLTITPRGDMNT